MAQKVTRGIRNKNPFNIIKSNPPQGWLGALPESQNTDPRFLQFDTMEHGIRAGLILIRNYIRQGHNTPERIINRFAPSTENHTAAYIIQVCQRACFQPTEIVNYHDRDRFVKFCQAITYVECAVHLPRNIFNECYDKYIA